MLISSDTPPRHADASAIFDDFSPMLVLIILIERRY
jgi:hypothetical protein